MPGHAVKLELLNLLTCATHVVSNISWHFAARLIAVVKRDGRVWQCHSCVLLAHPRR
jgi:hypothetical protein